MYIPKHYQVDDPRQAAAFMQAHSFGILVSTRSGQPWATHLPLLVDINNDEDILITGHLAKANPHAQVLAEAPGLAIFHGPHAYVSASLYQSDQNVSTWNYVAIHAYGELTPFEFDDQPDRIDSILAHTFQTYEPAAADQWERQTPKYRDALRRAIVGFEMPVSELQAKYKLSQNKSTIDQTTVAQHLLDSADPAAQATGQLMADNLVDP